MHCARSSGATSDAGGCLQPQCQPQRGHSAGCGCSTVVLYGSPGRAVSRQSRSADMQVGSLPRLVLNALRPFVPGSALKATSVAEIGCALAAMAGQLAPSTSTSLRPSSCWWAGVRLTCRWNPGMERRGRPRSGERLQGRQRRYERWCLTACSEKSRAGWTRTGGPACCCPADPAAHAEGNARRDGPVPSGPGAGGALPSAGAAGSAGSAVDRPCMHVQPAHEVSPSRRPWTPAFARRRALHLLAAARPTAALHARGSSGMSVALLPTNTPRAMKSGPALRRELFRRSPPSPYISPMHNICQVFGSGYEKFCAGSHTPRSSATRRTPTAVAACRRMGSSAAGHVVRCLAQVGLQDLLTCAADARSCC